MPHTGSRVSPVAIDVATPFIAPGSLAAGTNCVLHELNTGVQAKLAFDALAVRLNRLDAQDEEVGDFTGA